MAIGESSKQQNATVEPDKVQGQDYVEIVERSCVSRDRGVSIRAQAVLSRILGCEGVSICLNVVLSDPRVAYPYFKIQVRELVRVVGIVAPLPNRGAVIRGIFILSRLRG